MKKKLTIALMSVFIFGIVSAQELTSKKGEPYLPASGDWALGTDAAPFLNFVGNMFNGNTANSSPTFNYVDGVSIYGKMFTADDMAFRARLRILGMNNYKNVGYSADNNPSATPGSQVEDELSYSQMAVTIGFGVEKRRGSTRVQGLYGGEVFVNFGNAKKTYSYGNAMTATNPSPTSYDFDGNVQPLGRLTEYNYGSNFYAGIRPFIGVEYFFLPKMSVGAEYGFTIAFGGNANDEQTVEQIGTTGSPETVTTKLPGNNTSTLTVDTDRMSGIIKLLFHF